MKPRLIPLVRATRADSGIRLYRKNGWTCHSCRSRTLPWSAARSSSTTSEKPYYITTPIFYVNAAPHVGHFYTMVLSDILKRWQVLKGKKAILCTGTDEHGMKIQRAADIAGVPPKEFCDANAETFKTLAKRANLANDHFVRTTDEDHKEAVQYFWHLLRERGFIYESKHEGWYSVSDETYYPEATIEKRLDPFTGRILMASKETGSEVEWTSERNYHFRLTAFKEQLLKHYKENPQFVVPASRMNDVVKWVSEDLEDLSVSRPIERLTWGIPVPGDEGQTIYVWLDALINYITKAGYPWAPGKATAGGWPADVQVIGKDIVRFHCIYWPAFLLALGLPPAKQVLTHAHWTLNRRKMAKSTGNVVNPFFAMERFGVDVMRFYLSHEGGIANDSDYGNDHIVKLYKSGLQGGLGNLVSRVTRPKVWNVRKAVESCAAQPPVNFPLDEGTRSQIALLKSVRTDANKHMDDLDSGAALRVIMNVVYETNKYLQATSPWALAKVQDLQTLELHNGSSSTVDLNTHRVARCVFHAAEAIRIVGILLQPYMPEKAAELLDMLGVDDARRSYDDAVLGADDTYGTPKRPVGRDVYDALFPPLPVED